MNIKGFYILFISFLILSLVFLSLPNGVHAAYVTVVPSDGTVGTSIKITGYGFAGHWATVYWDNQMILTKVPISPTGELTCTLNVPPTPRGNHFIKITDDSGRTDSTALAVFTVSPQITVFPHIGRAHTTQVTVTGTGFFAFEKDIRITWDDNVLPTTATANHVGTWSIDFNVPEAIKGDHYISAFSPSTKASEVGKVKFIVAPAVKVEPLSGPVGTEVKIDGFGFRTGEDGITITWDGDIILCNIVGGADGSWNATVVIPPSTQGQHTIGVYGSSFTPKGVVPDTKFTVVPHIELQPSLGDRGTKVNVRGSGFAKNETVTISYNENTLGVSSVTDDTGSFNATFVVPPSVATDNKVTATGNKGNSARAIFVIKKTVPPAPNLLSPELGARLEVFGSIGDVFIGAAKQLVGIITFSGQQNANRPQICFDWSDCGKPGEISYVLQISRGNDFLSPDLIKENLTNSEYTLRQGDMLTQGRYSWRVKAVDDIGNESSWSEPSDFEIIPMSRQVFILSLFVLILLIVAITGIGISAWRLQRTRR